MTQRFPLYVGGVPRETKETLHVLNKYDGSLYAETAIASAELVEQAIATAVNAKTSCAALSVYERQSILDKVIIGLRQQTERLTTALINEVGKTIAEAKTEVARAIETFEIAKEEVARLGGEIIDLDRSPRSTGTTGWVKRVPIGVASFVTPFNFPLNLLAHKVAPAIAVGNPFLVKPASATPVTALILGEILSNAGLPAGSFSILPCSPSIASPLIEDERIAKLSFTGSAEVGWSLRAKAGKKRVTLELGGNAALVVDESADLEKAAKRCLLGAFGQAGQSCISVQRIYVARSVAEQFTTLLVKATQALKVGDPSHPATDVGPMVSEKEALRAHQWILDAQTNGATILCGGERAGSLLTPTLLTSVDRSGPLVQEEVFAPVAVIEPFDSWPEVVRLINQSRFGLQAGIFTNHLDRALDAWNSLEVGGVVVGDIPSFRSDAMPYGGVKDSGVGREGVRYAMEEMTERRLMVIRR